MKKTALIIFLIVHLATAGESLFGISEKSIGMLQVPYSSAGLARSFEVASLDSSQLSFSNFAQWARIVHTTYSVKGGYHAAFGKSARSSNMFNDAAAFEGGYFAFPVMKEKLAAGIGIQPFTSMEQRLQDESAEDFRQEILLKGGLGRILLNIAWAPKPWFGMALGYEYYLGKITQNYRLEYLSSDLTPLTFDFEYRFYGHGLVVSSYVTPLKNLTAGLQFRPPTTINMRVRPDTDSDAVNRSSLKKVTLPWSLNSGLAYKLSKRYFAGFDYLYQAWAGGYKIENESFPKLFNDYMRLGFGVERKSSPKLFTSFPQKLDYRLGLFYSKLNHVSNNNVVREYGLSFGLSLPVQRFISRVDLNGLIGKRGNLNDNTYEETFFMFGFTINASELWFVNPQD